MENKTFVKGCAPDYSVMTTGNQRFISREVYTRNILCNFPKPLLPSISPPHGIRATRVRGVCKLFRIAGMTRAENESMYIQCDLINCTKINELSTDCLEFKVFRFHECSLDPELAGDESKFFSPFFFFPISPFNSSSGNLQAKYLLGDDDHVPIN